jgi:hypothetical protein
MFKELKKTHEWFLELASLSPEMREQLEQNRSGSFSVVIIIWRLYPTNGSVMLF